MRTIFSHYLLKKYTHFFGWLVILIIQSYISLLSLIVAKPHQPPLLPQPTGTLATFARASAIIFIQCKNKFVLKVTYLIAHGFNVKINLHLNLYQSLVACGFCLKTYLH